MNRRKGKCHPTGNQRNNHNIIKFEVYDIIILFINRLQKFQELVDMGKFSWDTRVKSTMNPEERWHMIADTFEAYVKHKKGLSAEGADEVKFKDGSLFHVILEDGSDISMRNWSKEQRKARRQGNLSTEREKRLQKLVDEKLFDWGKTAEGPDEDSDNEGGGATTDQQQHTQHQLPHQIQQSNQHQQSINKKIVEQSGVPEFNLFNNEVYYGSYFYTVPEACINMDEIECDHKLSVMEVLFNSSDEPNNNIGGEAIGQKISTRDGADCGDISGPRHTVWI